MLLIIFVDIKIMSRIIVSSHKVKGYEGEK